MSDEYPAFDGVLPTAGSNGRPRTRGARRRPLPTDDVFKTAFGSPLSANKKSKTTAKSSSPRANAMFPSLGGMGQQRMTTPTMPASPATPRFLSSFAAVDQSAWAGSSNTTATREEVETTPAVQAGSLLHRLHASGVQRSHVQTSLLPNVSATGTSHSTTLQKTNQTDDARRLPPRRPVRNDTKPLVAPPLALHPSADGVLIPTRPVTSSSAVLSSLVPSAHPRTPRDMLLSSADTSSGDAARPMKKIPLTARDKFYMDQRAMTAPAYASGQSPRRQRPAAPTAPTAAPSSGNPMRPGRMRHQGAGGSSNQTEATSMDSDVPRRTEILSGHSTFKTFTESIADDLRRASATRSGNNDVTMAPSGTAPVTPDSFLYLHRVDSNPYHLTVTNHARINPDDYYTVSRVGITHFAHNSSEFMPLEKFERENYIYSLMVKLPFFKKYRLWKRFTLWKQTVNDRKRTMATLSLNQNLFVLLPHLHDALMRLRGLCMDLQRARLFDFDGVTGSEASGDRSTNSNSSQQPRTYTLGEFSIRLKAQKMECERQVDQFIAEAAMIAKGACETYLFSFLQETGFNELKHANANPASTSRRTKHSLAMLSPESKGVGPPKSAAEALELEDEMSYTERATMRTQCRKITKFLRVVEFLIADAMLRVAISSVERLLLEMTKIKDGISPVSAANATALSVSQAAVNAAIMARYKHAPLFRVEVSLRGGAGVPAPPMLGTASTQLSARPRVIRRQSSTSMVLPKYQQTSTSVQSVEALLFAPHQEHLRSQLETLVFNGLKAVTSRERLLSNAMFKVYLEAGKDDGLGGDGGDDDGGENNGELSGEGLDLDILIMEDSAFVESMQGLNSVVQEAYARADTTCQALSPFLSKYHANLAFCGRVMDPQYVYTVEVDELRDLLERYTKEIQQFDALPENFPCGLLLLDNVKLNSQLKPSPRKCLEQLHFLVPLVIQFKNANLMAELTGYNDTISAIPSSVDEYAETLAFLRDLQSRMDTVEENFSVLKSLYQLIEEYNVKISDMDHTNAFLISQRRAQLKTSMDLFESSCENYTEKFGIELEARIPKLVGQQVQLLATLSNQQLFQLDADPEAMVEYLGGVEYLLQELEDAVERHSFFEKTLSLPHTSAFEELGEIKTDLLLKTEIWSGMLTWNRLTSQWNPLQFPAEVDVAAITDEVVAFFGKILQWEAQLSPGMGPLCAHLKSRVEDYRVTMPILHDLRCSSFEERHYKELQELLGFSIRPAIATTERKTSSFGAVTDGAALPGISEGGPGAAASRSLTLGELVAMRLAPFAQQVNRIATDATQERLLKEGLDKIIVVWERMEFEVRAYKDSKDYSILVAYESIYVSLEESLVSLTSLLNSKYLAPIKDAANIWQRRLALFQETLDAWIECQRKWMHLETIFSAPDIQKQLPNESMMYTIVNQFWKDLMRKTREHRNCMKVSGAMPHTSGTIANLLSSSFASNSGLLTPTAPPNVHAGQISLLETLNRHNASLDKIEKSLEDYLETKRGFFPRFYFISNDELLEMLAHAKEPQSVQRHLCKCFDALVKLDISEDGSAAANSAGGAGSTGGVAPTATSSAHDILAMISPEGERVAFSRSLKARGNVEDWLNTVLSNMKVTLQRHMKSCLQDYQHASRESWLFRHPAQCVAVVSYIMWARECEVCFRSASNDPLKELSIWHQTICTQLSNLTRLVRTSLTKVQRSLVVSLVTTDVHFRDVVEDLIAKNVTSASDFIWVQQLRYYWQTDQDECIAQQANFRLKYGYEYMGACSRLVITPLTDRCWMTITGALTLSFGAAPSGPAGTGKTETSKDLAKALGTLCIVFNCSDQIDYKMMAKIFNGAIQSGSWVCLDEFNRIDIEVLSVVAQQMTTIRHARLRGATDLMFEGKTVPMRDHHVIITMNPGYVGRTELPDNLKVCFRPVAMMVPDYALIAEILLFAEGFQQAKPLSKKMTKLYKLCSEQLSQQPHYDFGMRAVKSVLLMAGALKRSQVGSSQDESLTLIKAMEDANIPKFVDEDIKLFRGILRDLFPTELMASGEEMRSSDPSSASIHGSHGQGSDNVLADEIDRQIAQQGLMQTPKWKMKIVQLFETLEVRIGVVQTGASGSGKSVACRILKDSLGTLREARNHADKRFQKVVSYVLNPKSIAMNELYGFFHPMTREWTDGLASSILRQCITEKSESMSARSSTDRGSQTADSGPFYWITFDGPIDVLWIESMNTVLDDNMTLCLANGERIKLLPKIQLLFEVSDTSSASPATVSRLGVIYYHPLYLGWRPVAESWVNALAFPAYSMGPPPLKASSNATKDVSSSSLQFSVVMGSIGSTARLPARLKERVLQCFELFVEPGLRFVRNGNRAAVPTSDICYISSMCSIFETLLQKRGIPEAFAVLNAHSQASSTATTASAAAANTALENQQNRCIDLIFLFSFVWAFGGNLMIDKWKQEFQEFVFALIETNERFFSRDLLAVSGKIASRVSQVNCNFFDFFVDFQHLSFVPWEAQTSSGGGNGASSSSIVSGFGAIAGAQASTGSELPPPLEFLPGTPLFQLIVPTLDMVKYSYVTRLMALDGMLPVYLTGTTGAGKSVLVHHLLRAKPNDNSHSGSTEKKEQKLLPIAIDFSAQTSSLVTQLTIESKLAKKRKTLLGAPANTLAVVFIDDVNMPQAEAHGAQPPIELLRQYLECRGVYDRDKFFWKEISDTVLIAAGEVPGGGRHALCPRFMRQFSAILCMPSSDETTMKTIFGSILSTHVTDMARSSGSSPSRVSSGGASAVSKGIKDAVVSIVEATIALYQTISQTLLPTPSKSYYLFNLRDVTKLMQGVVLGTKSCGYESLTLDLLTKLWAHECVRVFRDRLMDDVDKKWLSEQLVTLTNRHLGLSWTLEHVYESASERTVHRTSIGSVGASGSKTPSNPLLLFAPRVHSETDLGPQPYEQVADISDFEQHLNDRMADYGRERAASSPPKLVFFKEAIVHVAAIARILIQPRGHALLLGIAGSGKRSLARMACFMMDYRCYEIELTKNYGLVDFREALKSTMAASVLGESRGGSGRSIGLDGIKPTVLLLNESQLISEHFVEDINTLLNGGEIPKLFALDEYEKILSDVRGLLTMRQAIVRSDSSLSANKKQNPQQSQQQKHSSAQDEFSRADCEAYFRGQVQRAMHIVICHSPVGDVFRTRIRRFPSLINCVTIDYFDAWPSHALQYVADRFLVREQAVGNELKPAPSDGTITTELPAATRHAVAVLCMEMHQSVVASAAEFLARYKRHVYFTPKHFVDLIGMFLRVYREKQAALEAKLTRLSVGVIKLEETNALVATLQDELIALQPILQSKTIEAEQLLHQVSIDQDEAGRVAARVAQDEAQVKQQQREVSVCQADAQKDLNLALPALNAAVHALDSLDKKDITEVKAFIKPPLAVQVVMEAVCIMLGEKADWDMSKRVLSRSTFMNELKEYDKDNINPAILKRIRKYIDNPDFAVEEVKKVSRAAMSLCMWVHAIDTYARVHKEVAPKRQRLAEMNGVLAEANAKLAAKQQELAQVMGKVQALKDQCDTTLAEKQRLVHESELTQARLQRAERLTVGLKDERVRWKESIEQLRVQGKAVLGDAFLAATAISYLSPFNGVFRVKIMREWATFASKLVEISPDFSLIESYGDAMELRDWELLGLPSDAVSTENAIFVMKGNQQRWPLLIDPQQQATQWIQRLEAANHIECIKSQDRSLLQVVERTVRDGVPLLLEDLTEDSMEQALEPLLMKAFLPVAGDPNARQVKLGDHLVVANVDKFRLYLVTQIPNPHFVPDVFIRTNVINFTVTSDGLTEQLLGDVVRRERVEIEERKHNLLYSITQDQKMLLQIEIKILSLLSESKGNILDDVELIQALETAKHTSRVVRQRLEESEVTKQQLLQVRNQYQSVAVRGALLFFVVADLTTIDAMYQYSLEYFRRLFILSLDDAPASADLQTRLGNLKMHLMVVVYRNIARGLFEAHKLLFSALICFRIQLLDGDIVPDELQLLDASTVLANSGSASSARTAAPAASATGSETDPMEALLALSLSSQPFTQILECYRCEPSAWMEWMTSIDPFNSSLPGECDALLSRFQRLVLIRWLRDDAWTLSLRHFVEQTLGDSRFVEAGSASLDPRSTMATIFSDMDKLTPCLFILSSGADPISLLTQFAQEWPGVYPDKYSSISLGQGQGPIAERLLENATTDGHWLVLQNIHLAKSWIPRFEELLTTMGKPEKRICVHDDFRLFLTSFPVVYFPISILQNAVKVTNEPPKGIKANLQRSMGLLEGTVLEETAASDDEMAQWMSRMELQLVFGLSLFHAVIQERLKFGSLGWNLKYDFSDADFLSVVTLQRHLLMDMRAERTRIAAASKRGLRRRRSDFGGDADAEEADAPGVVTSDEDDDDELAIYMDVGDIPWDALHFLTGEIYYGGRVTDEFDRRCLMSNLQRFCSSSTVDAGADDSSPWVELLADGSLELSGVQQLFAVHDDSFTSPVFGSREAMAAFVNALPATMDAPFVFGMHPNANVFYLKQETQRLVSHILQLQATHHEDAVEAQHGGGADDEEEDNADEDEQDIATPLSPQLMRRQSSQLERQRRATSVRQSSLPVVADTPETAALQVARDIQQRIPRPACSQDSEPADETSPPSFTDHETTDLPDPFTVVLHQELAKCYGLLAAVHDGLSDVQRAIQGHVAMSPQLEQIVQSLWQHQVPLEWRKRDGASVVTATSTQSLASWVSHVRFRIDFLQQWETTGQAPNSIYPLSVFSFPQGFFTAILQCHARKYVVPIHHLEFQFVVLRESFLTSRKHMLRRGYSTRTQSVSEFEAEITRSAAAASTSGTAVPTSPSPDTTAASPTARRVSGAPSQQQPPPRAAAPGFMDRMDGAFISGLHLEGAQWSDELQCLVDPKPGVLHHTMPVIHVVPQVAAVLPEQAIVAVKPALSVVIPPPGNSGAFSRRAAAGAMSPASPRSPTSRTTALTPSYLTVRNASTVGSAAAAMSGMPSFESRPSTSQVPRMSTTTTAAAPILVPGKYICPLYKTRARKGTLSTTGISTNFVLAMELPCEKSPDHYALNGTALIGNLVL